MNSDMRKKKLDEIKNNEDAYMTGIRIRYKGENLPFNAYKIPLKFLVYNKYNGRIGSLVKSYEKQNPPLKPEDPEGAKKIESFLWDSKPQRNETTMKSLVRDGQKQWGIVTNDGIIIDGNRRAMLLNQIYRDRERWEKKNHKVEDAQYFISVILPEGAEPKEVSRLETTYQMGEDEKLDYNPIEKYLKCKDLKKTFEFTKSDIAEMMGEKQSQIEEWLEIMNLMDEYLEQLSYDEIYTRLEKREGQFVDLKSYLNRYENGSRVPDWNYDKKMDVADLKSVCFDYIRAQYEGKEFRYIAQPSKKEGFFCRGEIWKSFLNKHASTIEPISENEKTVEELRIDNPGEDLTKLLEARDIDWKKQVENNLKANLYKTLDDNKLLNKANQPIELLNQAIQILEKINTEIDTFYDDEVLNLVKKINSIAWDFQQLIKKNNR
jgi:hypothetical protein